MVVQTGRQVRIDTDKTPTDAPMYFDPTWHGLPLLDRCSGRKTARLHQMTSQYGPHGRVACDPSLDVEL